MIFFLIYLILLVALDPEVYSASNRNEYQKQKNNVSWSRPQPMRRAGNLTAISEPIVKTMWDPQHLTTLYASTACYGDTFTSFLLTLHIINLVR
jgi:hypothetical protein